MKTTVLTEPTNMTFRQIAFSIPGPLNHQTNVQIAARPSSTIIPAPLTAIRCHLPGSIQASETLAYKHGVNANSISPISWQWPP